VNEGDKSVSLALEVSKQNDELTLLRQESAAFRATLLQGINGGVSDDKNYAHVSLHDLLRIRLQEASAAAVTNNEAFSSQTSLKDESSVAVIQKLEQKLASEVHHSDELEAKCINLKNELSEAIKQNEGVEKIHVKISEMNGRLRNERELKFKLSRELIAETKKVEALSEHIEKLMIYLKHEAISKAKSLSDQSRIQRELDAMKTRIEHMVKRNERKDQVIAELRETGKLLEDQLRLMDEKYMEIRSKLDWTRSQTGKIVRQKEMELTHLREKFSMLADSTPRNDVSANVCSVVS
jgi:chromosome segregation ATPase